MSYKNLNKVHYILFLGLLLIMGCDSDPESESFVNVSYQYELRLHQGLSENGGIPAVQIISIEEQECKNAFISYQTLLNEEKILVYLNDIIVEDECETGNQKIRQLIGLPVLSATTPIEIQLKDVIRNQGLLHKNDLEFELDLHQFDGLKITRTKVRRIREQMLWGRYSSNNEEVLESIDEYLKSIDRNDVKIIGDYGYFYLDHNREVHLDEASDGNGFLISTDENFKEIKTRILELKEEFPSLEFEATNYAGSTMNIR